MPRPVDPVTRAYIEPVTVGGRQPDLPLFIGPGRRVTVPLEPPYTATWEATPDPIRELVAPPRRRR